jgi:hypothetical protein
MVDREKVFAICERVAEAQTLLNDRVEGNTAEAVVAKLSALLKEEGLQRAMWEVGYFPINTPPPATVGKNYGQNSLITLL